MKALTAQCAGLLFGAGLLLSGLLPPSAACRALSGICPGPGLVLLTTFAPGAFVFVAAMRVGRFLTRLVRSSEP
jgi:hypothetical protein